MSTNLPRSLYRNNGKCLPTYLKKYSETLGHVYQTTQKVAQKHLDMSTKLPRKLLRNTWTCLKETTQKDTQKHLDMSTNLPKKILRNTWTCLPNYLKDTQKHLDMSTNLPKKILRNTWTCLPNYPESCSETLGHVYRPERRQNTADRDHSIYQFSFNTTKQELTFRLLLLL